MPKKSVKLTRWQRLLRAHREEPWLTSYQQLARIGSVTISKVRSECRANGYRWLSRKNADGWNEWKPVRERVAS